MKELKFKITALFMILALVLNAEKPTKISEHSKLIEEEFSIGSDGIAGVIHKYGNVEFINTNSNKVKYEVTITVFTASESKAEEIFDNIFIDFRETNNKVVARTKRENKSNSWWNKMWNNGDEKYEINYKIYVPQNINLQVNNKYGNVTISDREKDVSVEIKYGDLTLGDIAGDTKLDIAYTNRRAKTGHLGNLFLDISYAEIKAASIHNAEIESKYSELRIDQAGQLEIDSKYDEYTIEKVDKLENDGMYDDFSIGEANYMDFKTKYTDIEVGFLQEKGIFELKYGVLSVDNTGDNLKFIEIDCDYTDLRFNITTLIKLELESNYTDVKLPSNKKVSSIEKENNRMDIIAILNGIGNVNTKMKVDMTYGSLKIKNR